MNIQLYMSNFTLKIIDNVFGYLIRTTTALHYHGYLVFSGL